MLFRVNILKIFPNDKIIAFTVTVAKNYLKK